MLTIYKPPPKEGMRESTYHRIIPIGKPYLTTVNGKCVFARDKPKKEPSKSTELSKGSFNLLGEAFGIRTKIVHHTRTKSAEAPEKAPVVIGGVTYVPQEQAVPYTAPIPQQPFAVAATSPTNYLPYPYYPPSFYPVQQHPHGFARTISTSDEGGFGVSRLIDLEEDYEKKTGSKARSDDAVPKLQKVEEIVEVKTTVTLVKHVCANCGRLRSRKFHMDHPIIPGVTPPAMFCRRCQKDASSTSAPDSEVDARERKAKKSKKQQEQSTKGKERDDQQPTADEEGESSFCSIVESIAKVLRRHDKEKGPEKSKNKPSKVLNVTFESTAAKENQTTKEHQSQINTDPEERARSTSHRTRRSALSPRRPQSHQSNHEKPERIRRSSARSPSRPQSNQSHRAQTERSRRSSAPSPIRSKSHRSSDKKSERPRKSTRSPSGSDSEDEKHKQGPAILPKVREENHKDTQPYSQSQQPRREHSRHAQRSSARSPTRSQSHRPNGDKHRRARRSTRSPSRSKDSEHGRATRGPPIPPKIRDENHKDTKLDAPTVNHMRSDDPSVFIRDFANQSAKPVPEKDKESQKQGRRPSVKRDRNSGYGSESSRMRGGSRQILDEMDVPEQGGQASTKRYRRPSYESASSELHGSSKQVHEDRDAEDTETAKHEHKQRPQAGKQHSHHSFDNVEESDTGFFNNSDSRRAETGYDDSDNADSDLNSQKSEFLPPAPATFTTNLGNGSRSGRRRQSRQSSDSGRSSLSTTSHHILQRSSSVNHSTSAISNDYGSHRSKRASERYVHKDPARSVSDPSVVTDYIQRRRPSRSSYTSNAQKQTLPTENYGADLESASWEHDAPRQERSQSKDYERNSDVSGRGISTRSRVSRSSRSTSSNSVEDDNASKTATLHERGSSTDPKLEATNAHSMREPSTSSHQARHRRRSDRSMDNNDLSSLHAPSSRQIDRIARKSSHRGEQKDHQSEYRYESGQDARSQRSRSSKEERQDENGFSTTDAAKHFHDDWKDNKADAFKHRHRESDRRSNAGDSERSYTTVDASKYYQNNWVANDDSQSQSGDGMKTPKQESSESDPTSSQIHRYYKDPGVQSVPGQEEPAGLPPPPLFIVEENNLQLSPVRRRFNSSSHSKHRKTPSIIWEGSEYIHGLGLGIPRSATQSGGSSRHTSMEVVSLNPSRRVSQESEPLVGVVSPAISVVKEEGGEAKSESVVHTPALEQDQESNSDSGSDTTRENDNGFDIEEEPAQRGIQTAATSFEDPMQNKTNVDGWYTVTESQLENMGRQDDVPGFGLGSLTGVGSPGGNGESGSGSPVAGWDGAVEKEGVNGGVRKADGEKNSENIGDEKVVDGNKDGGDAKEAQLDGEADGKADRTIIPNVGWDTSADKETGEPSADDGGGW